MTSKVVTVGEIVVEIMAVRPGNGFRVVPTILMDQEVPSRPPESVLVQKSFPTQPVKLLNGLTHRRRRTEIA